MELVDMKFNYLQIHMACRSFCSNEYMKGTYPLIIMSISGHRSHKPLMCYIKVSEGQFTDKLEKIWEERGGEIKLCGFTSLHLNGTKIIFLYFYISRLNGRPKYLLLVHT